ncbi:MAG: SAM-dependent methyltransferase [Flavobacteriaceae bacterium]|jgi:SAM-dependent methyltransferase
MSPDKKDPIGAAILAYSSTQKDGEIIVSSEICEDDVIAASYLLRSFEEMPEIEKIALANCTGNVLDIGAGAGIHASYLQDQGINVDCIDLSPGAVKYMQGQGLKASTQDFYEISKRYDTLLMMMNGIGITGTLSNLEHTLEHAKSLLTKNGKLLCDSTDIKYLYTDDDGALWVDLNTEYYGNFKFQMHFEEHLTDWFEWLYVDFNTLSKAANNVGLNVKLLIEEDHQYLAEITSAD